jgi:hypothetical protein
MLYDADQEIDEMDWRRAATNNPVFVDLADPAEDIYSLADGIEFSDTSSMK